MDSPSKTPSGSLTQSLLPVGRPPQNLAGYGPSDAGGRGGTRKSVAGAVFNLSTSIIGAGIMSIPAAVRVLGILPAFFLIAVVAFLSAVSAELLVRHTGRPCSYGATMAKSFGPAGAAALRAIAGLTTAGTLIVYLIIIADVVSGSEAEGAVHAGVLQQWFGERWWNGRQVALLITVGVFILPLALLRRIDSLKSTSAISVLLALVFVVISSGMALYALFQGTTETPRLLPDFAHLSSFFDLFTAVPVIVVAFTFHFNVHPIRAELEDNEDMVTAIRVSVWLCAVIYAAVGFFAYLLFGESTMADILSNFDKNTGSPVGMLLNDAVRLSYALHLILVFPLLFYALRINIGELLFAKTHILDYESVRFTVFTGTLLSIIYFAAIVIPSIWVVFQFSGSTTAVCLSLIFPGAIALREAKQESDRREKVLATIMIALAVITSSIAIASNIVSSFRGSSD